MIASSWAASIEAADAANPSRMDFERLHRRSVFVEESVLLLGLATVALVARAESKANNALCASQPCAKAPC